MARTITAKLRTHGRRRGKARPELAVAHRLRREGNLDEAEKIYRAHVEAIPDSTDAWIGLARVSEARRRFARAAFFAWKATRLSPADVGLLEYLAGLLVRARDYSRARIIYRELIKRSPSDLEARFALSALERECGDVAAACRVAEEGLDHAPFAIHYALSPSPIRVLRFYGMQNAHHRLLFSADGRATVYLYLGNFSTDSLITDPDFTTITYFIRAGALERHPPPQHDVAVNAIADPDVEARSLGSLASHVDQDSLKAVINDPRRVLETSRDANFLRFLGRPDIRFPMTIRLSRTRNGQFDLDAALARNGLVFPLILRVPGSHTGETVLKAETMAEARAYLSTTPADEIYVIQWIDCRYRGAFYRKMRLFFVDGQAYPVVHHIDHDWNVHGGNRRRLMAAHSWMTDVEKSFLEDPETFVGPGPWAALESLPNLIGLEFFGVDFSITEAGELLIYELNPCMRHSFDHARAFPYLQAHLQRISKAFCSMLRTRAEASRGIAFKK